MAWEAGVSDSHASCVSFTRPWRQAVCSGAKTQQFQSVPGLAHLMHFGSVTALHGRRWWNQKTRRSL